MEGDSYRLYISGVWKKFQPTPSVGRATCASSHGTNLNLHFNPRPPWGGRPISHERGNADETISIHALRGEGDKHLQACQTERFDISIHALRGEGDNTSGKQMFAYNHFNPRPPWGGRRSCSAEQLRIFPHFNPRPPWGGRHAQQSSVAGISRFQSTPSVGRATIPCDG